MNNDPALAPSIVVIFGVTGDLAKRKVLPALYHLFKDGRLHDKTVIVGTSRRAMEVDDFLKQVELCVLEQDNVCDPDTLRHMHDRMRLMQLDPVKGEDYRRLHTALQRIEDQQGVCMNRLFYLSIPPSVYAPVVRQLGEHHLQGSCKHGVAESRLLVEKPFGYDLVSAEELIDITNRSFKEEQIFRIDHYLAKETAQNILTFRRHNPLFARNWDSEHIQSLSIIAYEQIGIEGRADFYEQVGALRDLVQSHLLQLLALTTMELPRDISSSKAIHTAKTALLDTVEPPAPDEITQKVRRGQYEGYRSEVGRPDTVTETYAAICLTIPNQRWHGMPVRLATGKALKTKRTEIQVDFGTPEQLNRLTFRIQPDEGIDMWLQAKHPGFENRVQTVGMDFSYQSSFNTSGHPDAYERVLVDAIRGDRTLFATAGEVLASWRILQPVLDAWQKDAADLQSYPKGSDGDSL